MKVYNFEKAGRWKMKMHIEEESGHPLIKILRFPQKKGFKNWVLLNIFYVGIIIWIFGGILFNVSKFWNSNGLF